MAEDTKDSVEEKGFFDRFYNASKEILKSAKKPQVRRRLERKLGSALDDAEDRKLDAEQEITNIRESFDADEYDMNEILKLRQKIQQFEDMQKEIRAEYEFMFGKKM